MNKSELVKAIAEKTGTTVAVAGRAVDALFETIQEQLALGNRIELFGFGSFEMRVSKARNGRNPSTGLAIAIPSKKAAKFKASVRLNRAL